MSPSTEAAIAARKAMKVALQEDDYVDLDIYGRGFDGIFGYGAAEETSRMALMRLRAMQNFQENVKPGEHIEYDLYGRGDPRIFGEGADKENAQQALDSLKTKQKQKEERRRSRGRYVFPVRLFRKAFVKVFKPLREGERASSRRGNSNGEEERQRNAEDNDAEVDADRREQSVFSAPRVGKETSGDNHAHVRLMSTLGTGACGGRAGLAVSLDDVSEERESRGTAEVPGKKREIGAEDTATVSAGNVEKHVEKRDAVRSVSSDGDPTRSTRMHQGMSLECDTDPTEPEIMISSENSIASRYLLAVRNVNVLEETSSVGASQTALVAPVVQEKSSNESISETVIAFPTRDKKVRSGTSESLPESSSSSSSSNSSRSSSAVAVSAAIIEATRDEGSQEEKVDEEDEDEYERFDDTPRRVKSKLPSEEKRPEIEDGMVQNMIRTIASSSSYGPLSKEILLYGTIASGGVDAQPELLSSRSSSKATSRGSLEASSSKNTFASQGSASQGPASASVSASVSTSSHSSQAISSSIEPGTRGSSVIMNGGAGGGQEGTGSGTNLESSQASSQQCSRPSQARESCFGSSKHVSFDDECVTDRRPSHSRGVDVGLRMRSRVRGLFSSSSSGGASEAGEVGSQSETAMSNEQEPATVSSSGYVGATSSSHSSQAVSTSVEDSDEIYDSGEASSSVVNMDEEEEESGEEEDLIFRLASSGSRMNDVKGADLTTASSLKKVL